LFVALLLEAGAQFLRRACLAPPEDSAELHPSRTPVWEQHGVHHGPGGLEQRLERLIRNEPRRSIENQLRTKLDQLLHSRLHAASSVLGGAATHGNEVAPTQ